MKKLSEIIRSLRLERHPEGGYYRRTYQAEEIIQTEYGIRHAMTSIYYCLPKGEYSAFHKIKSYEQWFYHLGATIEMIILKNGDIQSVKLGSPQFGAVPTIGIPADTWFAARTLDDQEYALVSCIVCPGFDFDDFQLADKTLLSAVKEESREVVESLLIRS